ncbi:MAG: IS481 family transposase [Undibacterium sp.]|nr:IS481 family transposase [Opitutaceae bacterium]
MAWNEVTPMEEKLKFASLARSGRFTVTELCVDFGVSRKTGHKWLRRYAAEGAAGLHLRSRRPKGCAHQTSGKVEQLILRERRRHPTWGPKKLYAVLRCEHRIKTPPARSTIAGVLRRHGLSQRRRRSPGLYSPSPRALTQPTHPNHVWTVDFKGWFCTGDGVRCDPLTVCDRYSHYLIGCHARPNQQFKSTLRVFKSLLRSHGRPQIIRVDNGTPFASIGLGRLSQLSVWWILQGIEVEFTRPAHPQDNGSHERMHRVLKAECTTPPSTNLRALQRRLQRWQHTYNHQRPHETLGQQKPAQIYRRSQRRLHENDKILRYPKTYVTRVLSENGQLRHEGHTYHVGEALAGCRVGLFVNASAQTELHFANLHLGNLVYDPAGYDPGR